MKRYKIVVWDNGDQNSDQRNSSKKLLEIEVDAYSTNQVPKMPLMQALRVMYPDTQNIKISCVEIIDSSTLAYGLKMAIAGLESQHLAYGGEGLGELIKNLKKNTGMACPAIR